MTAFKIIIGIFIMLNLLCVYAMCKIASKPTPKQNEKAIN